jgi:hypothetical protein
LKRCAGQLGDLELNRASGLSLDNRRSILYAARDTGVVDPQTDKSQLRSLLSLARLNIARSRVRSSTSSRTRIAETSFGRSGRF